MPSLITPAELKAFQPTGKSDATCQQIIDGNEAYMNLVYPTTARTVVRVDSRPNLFIWLDPPADPAVTATVRERYSDYISQSYVDLATNDWQFLDGGRRMERLLSGTNPADTWGMRTEITYTPLANLAIRKLALLKLCQVDIQHSPGIASFTVGKHSETSSKVDYADEKDNILSTLLGSIETLA